jgi:hypothetical protein
MAHSSVARAWSVGSLGCISIRAPSRPVRDVFLSRVAWSDARISADNCGTRFLTRLSGYAARKLSPRSSLTGRHSPVLEVALKARRDKSPRWGTPSAVLGEMERGGVTDIHVLNCSREINSEPGSPGWQRSRRTATTGCAGGRDIGFASIGATSPPTSTPCTVSGERQSVVARGTFACFFPPLPRYRPPSRG